MGILIRVLVHDYGWIHTGIGLVGNVLFFIGSIYFLPSFESWKVWGVWLFIAGAALMSVGSLGRLLVSTLEPADAGDRTAAFE